MEWWDYLYLNEGQHHATTVDNAVKMDLRLCNLGKFFLADIDLRSCTQITLLQDG
jgi:hypothetical protein